MNALFDTHCHLDASEFDADRDHVIAQAKAAGVEGVLIPAVQACDFEKVRALAHGFEGGAYAVGIHPMFVRDATKDDLKTLANFVQAHRDDERLVAIGEIGLDFFVPEISHGIERQRQIEFYKAQLDIAHQAQLPVILHVRKSQDELLKWLRRLSVQPDQPHQPHQPQQRQIGGIAHAFNGSFQQAHQFIELGFALGAGGAFTFTRAKQIRRLVTELSLEHWVLETDSPDMAPAWLEKGARNCPAQVAAIANELATLREVPLQTVLEQTAQTAVRVIPKLRDLWTPARQ